MTDTNQLPPLPTPKFTETIRGVPCITVTEHEHLIRAYALQARAQVQGEPVNLQYMAVAENGALRWMTGRKVQNCELYAMPDFGRAPTLYTTPQPAQATQAEANTAPADPMLVTEVKPRQLSYSLDDYHRAPSKGALHYTWQDKPHRLLYDLIAAVAYYADKQPATPEPVEWMASYVDPVGNDHVYVTSHRDLAVGHDMHGEPKPLYTHPAAPSVPADVVRDAEWYRLIRDGSGWPAVFAAHDAPEPLRGDDLDAAMRAAKEGTNGKIN